jgi:hypothetical protein
MNSLDAIISITILLASTTILLTGISEVKENLEKANNQLEAIITAQKCASIIDSIYSNSATEYQKEINCSVEEDTIISKVNTEEKKSQIITTAKNEKELKVEMLEHYTN